MRINYEILGNLEPALHAHLFPRYASEPDGLRQGPIWHYDWNAAPPFDAAKQAPFMARVKAALTARGLTQAERGLQTRSPSAGRRRISRFDRRRPRRYERHPIASDSKV